MTGKRILLEHCLHHSSRPVNHDESVTPAQQSDARSRWQPDHPTKHSIAVRSTTTSTFPATRRVPLASLISIDANGDDAQPTRPDLLREMSDKVTGRSLLGWLIPSRPFAILLAPVKNLVGVDRMPPRYAYWSGHLLLTFPRRFGASLQPIAAVSLLACVSSRTVCSDVSIYFLVDTYRCAHIGQHPYLLSLRPDGSHQSLTERMRGDDDQQEGMFSYISPEKRVPADHPLRPAAQDSGRDSKEMSPKFQKLYSKVGGPSVLPERLLRSLLLQIFIPVRSERMLIEQLQYNLLFRWFVGMEMDQTIVEPRGIQQESGAFAERRDLQESVFQRVLERASRTCRMSISGGRNVDRSLGQS